MLKLKNKNHSFFAPIFTKPLEFEPVSIENDELIQGIANPPYEQWVLEDRPPDPEVLQAYLQNVLADTAINDYLD